MTLYVVATPIGNLDDMTYRAIDVLRDVDLIFCEDTRVTSKILSRYQITTPTESLNTRTEARKAERVIELLREGRDIALVSDAGTPAISDPGVHVVLRVRDEAPDVAIIPIPGPSALTAALSVAGIAISEFTFYRFLPHKKGRQTTLKEIADSRRASVLFESPHRIDKLLVELVEVLEPDRRVFLGRELTKMFEETKVGTAEELRRYLVDNPDKKRGEFVVVVEGA